MKKKRPSLVVRKKTITEEEHKRLLAAEKAARTQAEESSRSLDEFLALVSHELRTPMTAMMGWLYILRSGKLGKDEFDRALDVVERNMRWQARIIEDLLDVSSIITGKLYLEKRPVELKLPLHAAIESLEASARAKRLRFEAAVQEETVVLGDPVRLQQVFWNLLSNAIKFSPEGGVIRARIRREGANALVTVQDEGIGISIDFMPHIFDLFRQWENSLTRQHGGLGIGLAIVRHLVALQGGSVKAASPGHGKGATFTVTLPSVPAGHAPQAALGAPARSSSRLAQLAGTLDGLRILLVDDDPDTLLVISSWLKHCGADVVTAASAPEAFGLLLHQKPDLLISDIAMPGEDGYSLVRKVRALGAARGGDIRAVALSARTRDEDRRRSLEAGYQTYLPKPVEPAELVSIIRRLFGRPSVDTRVR